MRMSCNGCRVLRKGCNEDCTIRPCLQWIKSPDSQANATLFLAKFYGRAGLINLIAASPRHLRPATFRSLLYEACGRIVSPAYGSAGLLWSGNWARCQAAVEAVLKGSPIVTPPTLPSQINVRAAQVVGTPNPKSYDIRHVSKEDPTEKSSLNRIRDRPRFKKSAPPSTLDHLSASGFLMGFSHRFNQLPGQMGLFEPANINSSGSWLGQKQLGINGDSGSNGNSSSSKEEGKSLFSVETVEGSPMKMAEPDQVSNNISLGGRTQGGEVDLDLTLGLGPIM